MSFGLLKRREPEKVQRSLRPHQEISFGLLKKREPEKVQRRSQESPLRRVQSRQDGNERKVVHQRWDRVHEEAQQRQPRNLLNRRKENQPKQLKKSKDVEVPAVLSKEILKGAEPVKPCHHQTEEEIESNCIASLEENCEELVAMGDLLVGRTAWCEKTKTNEKENNSEDGAAKRELFVGKGFPKKPAQKERNVQWEKIFHTTCHIQVKGKPHGVLFPVLIKERPPDLYQHFLAQDFTVSRTKLFQEEEYDVILLPPEKTHGPCSGQMKFKLNFPISTTTWTIISTHQRFTSNWNPFNQSSDEGDIEFTSQMIFSLLDLDQRTFNGGFRENQKELSYEPNFPGILNHPKITSNWISIKIGSDLEDMNFTTLSICMKPYCATEPMIESHSPTQELSRHKTTCIMFLDLLSFQQAQEEKKWISDHKVITHFPKRVKLVLYLKNSKPSPIKSFQTYVWHPGGISSKPSKPNSWS